MIKPVKRNKRLVWDRSRYGIQARQRAAWQYMQRAQILAGGLYRMECIKGTTNRTKIDKALALTECLKVTIEAVAAVK